MKWQDIQPPPAVGDTVVFADGTRALVGDANAEGFDLCGCEVEPRDVLAIERAPKHGRLAALEAFARAFADAEWTTNAETVSYPFCDECEGCDPEHYDRVVAMGRKHAWSLEGATRGHRPDCARGAAVAGLKGTA